MILLLCILFFIIGFLIGNKKNNSCCFFENDYKNINLGSIHKLDFKPQVGENYVNRN